jgi:photosystem II stability/assembly factor-like uncharacterized protein
MSRTAYACPAAAVRPVMESTAARGCGRPGLKRIETSYIRGRREPAGSRRRPPLWGERVALRLHAIGIAALILLLAGCGHRPRPVTPATAATPTATATPAPTSACVPVAGQVSAAPAIRVSPTSGGPGTIICITGYLPGGPDAAHATETQRNGTVCWDGCTGGLTESAQVAWSSARAGFFATKLTVPVTAWLTADGPKPLAPASYRIGVQCIAPTASGCAREAAQAAASFRLTGAAPQRCGAGQPCAALTLSPGAAIPGTTVQVSGWAPLTQIIGQPMGYTLVLEQGSNPPQVGQVSQGLDGTIQGSFRVPVTLDGQQALAPGRYTLALAAFFSGGIGQPVAKGTRVVGNRLLLAPTPLTVSAAPTWASLGTIRPLAIQPSADLFGGGVMAEGSTLAYCVPGGVRLSRDGGQTWAGIPTAGVAAAAATAGYSLQRGATSCAAALADPAHVGTVYAAFGLVTPPCDCAPPYFMVGMTTTDAGRTWQVIPQPAAIQPDHGDRGFGGFEALGDGVAALFGRRGSGAPTVETSTDGGRTWTAGQLDCPATGPCVRWGPAPSQESACMASFPQPLEARDPGGAWSPATQVDLCQGTSQAVALSATELALLSGRAPYPLQISRDGGRTWTDVALPALAPGQAGFEALGMLPDGALLAESQPPSPTWALLPPGARAWCPVGGLSSADQSSSLTAADGRLWWLAGEFGGKAPTLHSLPLRPLGCR